jgi:asparagine synthase (glutamine-hydrolysing)
MCGIAGIIQPSDRQLTAQILEAQLVSLAHRGPNGAGTSIHTSGLFDVGLCHRRLSIIDLSNGADQPMHSACGRYSIIFNGEVYNYIELRKELEAAGVGGFRTASDTEVILQALIHWGPTAQAKFNGMWGIAFLDRQKGALLLSRDRFGVKPLYLHWQGGRLIFASEIKAILEVLGKRLRVDHETAYRCLVYNSLDTDARTFFEGITKLPQGHYQVFKLGAAAVTTEPPIRYWDFTPVDPGWYADQAGLAVRVRELLRDAVALRLRSDVPVGLLLSGGVDSSCIAALMMKLSGPIKPTALAAVSNDAAFSEERFIDIATREIGIPTQKVNLHCEPAEALRLLTEVTYHNDEPVGTFSNVAQYLLMAKAKAAGITVILSGQGADEILCGYNKYTGFYTQSLLRQGRWAEAAKLLYGFYRNGSVLNQFHLADAKRYLPRWLNPVEPPPLGAKLLAAAVAQPMGIGRGTLSERQKADLYRFSVPMLTHYEDRMSMAHGREIRLPFLDYRLVNLLVQAPPETKLNQGWTKHILRQAMAPLVPDAIIWRRDKQGFINPERSWLANELRPTLTKLFNSDMLAYQSGLLDRTALLLRYERYCGNWQSKRAYSAKDIFYPLALETWLQRFASHLAL